MRLLLCATPLLLAACVQKEQALPPASDEPARQAEHDAAERAHQEAVREFNELIAACDAAAVRGRTGERLDAALQQNLLEESGAATLRVVRPGQPVSMDYRTDRLTVKVDGQDVITRMTCG